MMNTMEPHGRGMAADMLAHLQTSRNGEMRRAARLAMLRHQVIHHIERTEASAQKVEQAIAMLAEANALTDPGHAALRSTSDQTRPPSTILRARPSRSPGTTSWASSHCRAWASEQNNGIGSRARAGVGATLSS
ncbi:hypothetical protein CIT31_29825 [Mesorhizobium wenxiniae]|uniref:Uncharacterized protein n=1 Tax=Mesorhizobium wenxiniae TaxID=2014805 RepID=A0A271KAE7_9HYPH|nr:hypothetical protein CIT31_29825 [Mesorhizobium wenxiniae]